MSESHIEWTAPAPLWWQGHDPSDGTARRAFRTPAILRFASDSFMDDFHNLMKADPARLSELVALPETWSAPPGEPDKVKPQSGLTLKLTQLRNSAVRRLEARQGTLPAIPAGPPQRALKLYQPAHQRFYLVSACLVCRVVGLPDRIVDTTKQEKVSFVVRLLQPRTANVINPDPYNCDEFAFLNGSWQHAANPALLLDGEETNALSPLTYTELDRRTRRLFTGLVPVGRREAYLAASQPKPATDTDPAVPLVNAGQMLFKTQVTVPWSALEDTGIAADKAATAPAASVTPQPSPDQLKKIRDDARDQILSTSWYVFLDFANFLANNIPNVWNGASQSAAEQTLLNTLTKTKDATTGMTFLAAMRNAKQQEQTLENIKVPYSVSKAGWPSASLIFPLAEPSGSGVRVLSPPLTRDTLETQLKNALPPEPVRQKLPVRLTAQAGSNPTTSPWFTVRCVLERPNCPGLSQPLVSEPSAAFQMSAYFDPDAPARPIRIGLPIDTTPAGLRKFDKNTAFVMSDTLCGQMKKAGSLTLADLVLSVLPFPFHKGLDTGGNDGSPCLGGMVCSFSIPIITICALILLIIIVKLFDIIFFWMPFFQVCLPLPKFNAKGNS
jgi:hypothetical protein